MTTQRHCRNPVSPHPSLPAPGGGSVCAAAPGRAASPRAAGAAAPLRCWGSEQAALRRSRAGWGGAMFSFSGAALRPSLSH